MIMIDRSRRLREPLQWGRREKLAVGTLLACVLLALGGLGAYALTSGAPSRHDCIEVTFASTLGAATQRECGGRARRLCASGGARGIEAQLRAACEHAGLAFGRRR
jgi:hypothetical protein